MGRKKKVINEEIHKNNEKNTSFDEVHNPNFMEVQEKQEIQEIQQVKEDAPAPNAPAPGAPAPGAPAPGAPAPDAPAPDAPAPDAPAPDAPAPDAGTIEDLEKMLKVHEDLNPEIKEVKAEPETNGTETEPEKNNPGAVGVDISMFITPRLIIIIYDTIYPKILSYVAKNFLKIDVNENINLDEDQIELLEPIVAEMIKGVSMKMNPLTAFLICSNFFYVSKLMDQPQKNEYPEERPKPRKKKRGRPRKVIISNGL